MNFTARLAPLPAADLSPYGDPPGFRANVKIEAQPRVKIMQGEIPDFNPIWIYMAVNVGGSFSNSLISFTLPDHFIAFDQFNYSRNFLCSDYSVAETSLEMASLAARLWLTSIANRVSAAIVQKRFPASTLGDAIVYSF